MDSEGGGALERRFELVERVGEDVCPLFQVQVANGVIKKNRDGGGASNFDGFCLMVGRNNQLKSGRIVWIYLGEAARRAIMIREDAVESIPPSNFEAKNK
jgi:hypothetical protein